MSDGKVFIDKKCNPCSIRDRCFADFLCSQGEAAWFRGGAMRRLFYRNALCQLARLVDIRALDNRDAFGAPALDMPVNKSGDAGRIVAAIL
jgi:hypothetical protein